MDFGRLKDIIQNAGKLSLVSPLAKRVPTARKVRLEPEKKKKKKKGLAGLNYHVMCIHSFS